MREEELTEETLSLIKDIEAKAYEGTEFAQMQDIDTVEELAEYMDCGLSEMQLLLDREKRYYLLVADREEEEEVEVVGFAKDPSSPGIPSIKAVLSFLEQFDTPITMSARESTSYPIVQALTRAGKCRILECEPSEWGGETFYDITLTTTKALDRGLHISQDEYEEER